jgi:hypothetical protein
MRLLTTIGTLTLGVLSPVGVQGQTFHLSEHVIARSPGSGILSRPDSLPLGVLQGGADVLHLWKTVIPPEERTTGRRRSAVESGAVVGFTVGMVAGLVIWANRKCEGMACLAKPLGFPMYMIGYGGIGAIVGASLGFVVGSTPSDYRQLRATPPMPHFRVGVSLAL